MNDDVAQVQLRKIEPLRVGNKTFKSAYDWELSEKNLEKAALELGETEEKKKECLRQLKKKLSDEPNIKYRQDDFYLLRFLRVRKYDVKKAYNNVKLFFEQRNKHPQFFTLSQDMTTEMKRKQKMNILTFLPYTDEEDRILVLLNFGIWNPEEWSFEEVVPSVASVADLCTMNPHCQINGIVAIYDLGGMTMRHVTELLSKSRLWIYTSFAITGYPWRIKKVYILNSNRLVRFVYGIVKPFLARKIQERCVFLGSDMSELHQYVNPDLLPKRLEGNLEDEDCDASQHVFENLPYLRYERSFV